MIFALQLFSSQVIADLNEPNAGGTVLFSASADLSQLSAENIKMSFWEKSCKECAYDGVLTKNTLFFDQAGEPVSVDDVKKDQVFEVVSIRYENNSDTLIESIHFAK